MNDKSITIPYTCNEIATSPRRGRIVGGGGKNDKNLKFEISTQEIRSDSQRAACSSNLPSETYFVIYLLITRIRRICMNIVFYTRL